MINLESTIMLPYFFVCLAKVSQLVGCFYFVGGDVGVAVLAVVAVFRYSRMPSCFRYSCCSRYSFCSS